MIHFVVYLLKSASGLVLSLILVSLFFWHEQKNIAKPSTVRPGEKLSEAGNLAVLRNGKYVAAPNERQVEATQEGSAKDFALSRLENVLLHRNGLPIGN